MADSTHRPAPDAQAAQRVQDILRAADSWSKEAPSALTPAIRAVCLRLAEMVADQRHYLAPLPQQQEQERAQVLSLVAERLRSKQVIGGLEPHLEALSELELRSTGSWAINAAAQNQWINTAVQYLEGQANRLPAPDRPDPYWAEDVVAGIIASLRALIGVDELHARTEAQYAGGRRDQGLPRDE
jgi:hypothetical protein